MPYSLPNNRSIYSGRPCIDYGGFGGLDSSRCSGFEPNIVRAALISIFNPNSESCTGDSYVRSRDRDEELKKEEQERRDRLEREKQNKLEQAKLEKEKLVKLEQEKQAKLEQEKLKNIRWVRETRVTVREPSTQTKLISVRLDKFVSSDMSYQRIAIKYKKGKSKEITKYCQITKFGTTTATRIVDSNSQYILIKTTINDDETKTETIELS